MSHCCLIVFSNKNSPARAGVSGSAVVVKTMIDRLVHHFHFPACLSAQYPQAFCGRWVSSLT